MERQSSVSPGKWREQGQSAEVNSGMAVPRPVSRDQVHAFLYCLLFLAAIKHQDQGSSRQLAVWFQEVRGTNRKLRATRRKQREQTGDDTFTLQAHPHQYASSRRGVPPRPFPDSTWFTCQRLQDQLSLRALQMPLLGECESRSSPSVQKTVGAARVDRGCRTAQ